MNDLTLMEQLLAEDPERFTIAGDVQAEWAARKVREMEAERDRLVRTAQDLINLYQDHITRIEAACAAQTSYLLGALENYFDTVDNKTATKTQETYRLTAFRLKRKYQAPKPNRDDDALLRWAKETAPAAFVRTKEEPAWSAIKAACVENGDRLVYPGTGEIVPGVTLEPRPPVFTIEDA